MKVYRCENCSSSFLEKRSRCYNCRSDHLLEYDVSSGIVLDTVQLFATPDNLPETYYIIRISSDGITFFCRSPTKIGEGEKVSLMEDDNSICCKAERDQI